MLLDERLVHWFAQNYDLTGDTTALGRSPIDCGSPLASKISPMPIGLDLHTLDEKKARGTGRISACEQQRSLHAVQEEQPLFLKRPLRLLAPFKCPAHAMHPDRIAACRWLRSGSVDEKNASVVSWLPRTSRSDFWRAVGSAAFVATPQGQGIDVSTHPRRHDMSPRLKAPCAHPRECCASLCTDTSLVGGAALGVSAGRCHVAAGPLVPAIACDHPTDVAGRFLGARSWLLRQTDVSQLFGDEGKPGKRPG